MKTKKKFGMRRHIGITAAATLIALGATACDDSIYWGKTGSESNKDIYENFVKHFGSEDGSFDFEKVVVCGTREKDEKGKEISRVMSANCLWNQNAEGNGENSKACSDDSIQHLKIMYATDAVIDEKIDTPPRVIVMCSLWQAGKKLIAGIGPNGKMLESSDKDVDSENHYNLCVNADHNLCSDGDCSKLVCKELAYYVDGNGGYINCEQSRYADWCKKISLGEIPDSFKAAFNYRTCPKDYTFASSYLESSNDYKLGKL